MNAHHCDHGANYAKGINTEDHKQKWEPFKNDLKTLILTASKTGSHRDLFDPQRSKLPSGSFFFSHVHVSKNTHYSSRLKESALQTLLFSVMVFTVNVKQWI